MKCAKDTVIGLAVVLTTISIVSGVLIDQTHKATAEIQIIKEDNQREIDQLRDDLKDDLAVIRADVQTIKAHLLSD